MTEIGERALVKALEAERTAHAATKAEAEAFKRDVSDEVRQWAEAIVSEAMAAISSDGKERDPYALGRCEKMARTIITKLEAKP